MPEDDQERVPAEGGDTFTLASAGDPYGPGSGHDLPPTPDGEPILGTVCALEVGRGGSYRDGTRHTRDRDRPEVTL